MSLARVSSIDGLERLRSSSPYDPQTRTRKLSFNPVENVVPTMARKESTVQPLPFKEVSKGQRTTQIVVAIIYCLFAAGIVFGYAAIKPVLISEGVFRNLCTQDEIEKGVPSCYGQEIRLNLMFTVAAVSTNVAALPIGTILDRYGPRVCGVLGAIFIFIGSLLFSFAGQIAGDAYTAGYFFLALGGPFIFISSFQLSNAFPQHSGLILALLTGAFDTSSALFLVFRLLHQATEGAIGTKKLFLAYSIVPILILFVQLFIMPADSYKSVSDVVKEAEDEMNAPTPPEMTIQENQMFQERRQSISSEIQTLLDTSTNTKRAKREENKNKKSGVWGVLHGQTALEQIKTPWFWLIAMFTVVQMTRINYFVATVRSQELWLLGSEERAKAANDFFDIALPVGGVLSIPFIGTILDHTSTTVSLSILVIVATIIGVLGCLPYMWAAIANICLFVVYRPFYYTAVSDYSAKVFGFQTFGKVYGLIICLAGILNFVQSPLDALTHGVFHNNPIPVNVFLLASAIIVGSSLVVYVYVKGQSMHRDELEDEAEHSSDTPIPHGSNTTYGTT